MARCKRILLFIQSNLIPISLNWAGPMREAFGRAGVDCVFYPQGLNPATEATLLDIVRPDCVLAMNQFRSEVLAERLEIKHIAWLQDDQTFGADHTRTRPQYGSDIVYYMSQNLRGYFPHISAKISDILMFGADRERCGFRQQPAVSDFSFIGYIPPRPFLTQNVDYGNGISFKLMDIFPFVAAGTGKDLDRHPRLMTGFLKEFFKSRKITKGITAEQETFIRENVLRAFYRWTHVLLAQSVSQNIRLFGPDAWRTWSEFSGYYSGELWSLDKANDVFSTTRINLHNGASLFHPRVFECLGAGGFLMTNKVRGEPQDAMFVDGQHLVRYDRDNFIDLATRYLHDERARAQVGQNAVDLVLRAHTWDHRVAQILRDVEAL